MAERIINTDTAEQTAAIFGSFDGNIRRLERAFGVTIVNRDSDVTAGSAITVSGEPDAVNQAAAAIEYLMRMTAFSESLSEQTVDYVIRTVAEGREEELAVLDDDCVKIMEGAFRRLNLSARAYDRILRVARTIADVECSRRPDDKSGIVGGKITKKDVMEAVQMRALDKYW